MLSKWALGCNHWRFTYSPVFWFWKLPTHVSFPETDASLQKLNFPIKSDIPRMAKTQKKRHVTSRTCVIPAQVAGRHVS